MSTIDTIMTMGPVIPVLVIDDVDHARPIAEALVAGGLRALEVTLRTPVALDAIREMSKVEGAVVGAGTVLNHQDLHASLVAGAEFVVSPGLTPSLAREAIASGISYLPGIQTASDIMYGLDLGLNRFKFFPATGAGGIPVLKALAAAFHQCRFCPTGGITRATMNDWLGLDCVLCVGGSWLVPKGPPNAETIRANAAKTAHVFDDDDNAQLQVSGMARRKKR
jgi:2-dehydro-3-deoxyphosphogluconate aldolase/(4S)-4-hydroxy-2-oxoglutarate aldolase